MAGPIPMSIWATLDSVDYKKKGNMELGRKSVGVRGCLGGVGMGE